MVMHRCLEFIFNLSNSASTLASSSPPSQPGPPTLTGDSQYFKLGGGVLYHPTSGRICHAPGQDPLHSDNDGNTVYAARTSATHGILTQRSTTLCLPILLPYRLLLSKLFLSGLVPSEPHPPHRQSMPLAVDHKFCDLGHDLWHLLLQSEHGKCV